MLYPEGTKNVVNDEEALHASPFTAFASLSLRRRRRSLTFSCVHLRYPSQLKGKEYKKRVNATIHDAKETRFLFSPIFLNHTAVKTPLVDDDEISDAQLDKQFLKQLHRRPHANSDRRHVRQVAKVDNTPRRTPKPL
jgi:hypothetical protein